MSTDQEAPESQVETENQIANEESPEPLKTEQEPCLKELQEQLAQAEQKAQENWDKMVRMQAEMENMKRRTQRDLENAHKFALENFAKALLPVLDSLELGLQAANGDSPEVQKFREGSELTIKQFESVFSKFNIVTIDPVGQPFNAEQHQAMMVQEIDGAEPNTVVNVFQKGYMLNGRLLRPAMVVVAKAPDITPVAKSDRPDAPINDEQA